MPGVTSVLAAAAALGTVSVLARDAYTHGSEPISLLGARLLVAAAVLTPFALRERPSGAAAGGAAAALTGLAFAGAGLGEFEALSRAAAPAVVLIVFLAPVWIALGRRLARAERLGRPRAAALASILCGAALVVAPAGAAAPNPTAVAFALGASAMSALFFVGLESTGRRLTPRRGACLVAWAAALPVVAPDPGSVLAELSRPSTAAHGVAIGVLTALALRLLAGGVPAGSALVASAVICVEPLAAGALAWLVLGELLSPVQLAGGTIVLAGVALLSGLSARAPPSPSASRRTTPRPRGSPRPPRPARTARRRL
jgi:drug/metabolite transporter (DMT)-like permease